MKKWFIGGALVILVISAIAYLFTDQSPIPSIADDLKATPMSGEAPLTVKFSWAGHKAPPNDEPCPRMEFGDGTSQSSIDGCPSETEYTYTRPGTYEAKVFQVRHTCPMKDYASYEQSKANRPHGCPVTDVVGTAVIVVR